MAVMVFLSMYSRLLLSPLLVYIQADLAIGPAQATRFFLPLSLAYSGAMLGSGFLSERVGHRRTIATSGFIIGLGLIQIALATTVPHMYIAFAIIGVGAGLYPPSGVTSVTELVESGIRGKAIAIHEVGPNSAYVVAPLVVAAAVVAAPWRAIPAVSGILAIVLSVTFDRVSVAGGFRGQRPQLSSLAQILRKPEFWALTAFFSLAASSTMGVFAILPTFLVNSEGYDPGTINTLISLSRMSGVGMIFAAGYLVDRIGVRPLIGAVMAITGALTLLIGVTRGGVMLAFVFLQPVVITAFFPPAISAIADLGPPDVRNVAVSVMIPAVNLIAGGVFPVLMGFLTERGTVRGGFVALGAVMLLALAMLPMLRRDAVTPPGPGRIPALRRSSRDSRS
jgi:MFS transporter, NNP family, nitrate/nitrite transporter